MSFELSLRTLSFVSSLRLELGPRFKAIQGFLGARGDDFSRGNRSSGGDQTQEGRRQTRLASLFSLPSSPSPSPFNFNTPPCLSVF